MAAVVRERNLRLKKKNLQGPSVHIAKRIVMLAESWKDIYLQLCPETTALLVSVLQNPQ